MPRSPSAHRIARIGCVLSLLATLGGCQSGKGEEAERIRSDPKERFTETEYGVKASPRVTDLKKVPKGGGRLQVGRPYKVKGQWYTPRDQPGYNKTGNASWYGASFHGRLTANGEVYDMFGLSGAHPTFPLPSYAKVTNLENGASVVVRVNDRGPYVADRVMDLSSRAADLIGTKRHGVGHIRVEYVGRAPLNGDDTATLLASYKAGPPDAGLPAGVMVAANEARSGRRSPNDALSIDAIIGTAGVPRVAGARRAAPVAVAAFAPTETAPRNGATVRLAEIAAAPPEPGSRIVLGALENDGLRARVARVVAGHGVLLDESDAGGQAFAIRVDPGANAEALLVSLWQAGARDAFVVHN